jgi:hypothetical protein
MSRRARELIEARYTWPRVAEACVEAYGRRGGVREAVHSA